MSHRDTTFVRRVIEIARGRCKASTTDWENRAFKRRPCDGWVALVHFDADGRKSKAVTLRGEDLSAGGMGVYSWQELPVGTRGTVMINGEEGQPILLGAKVVYCRPRSRHDYQVGIRFAEQPAAVTIEDFTDADGAPLKLGPALAA